MRPLGLLAGAALLLGACAQQPEPLTISEITVDADLSALGSAEAVSYWQNLSSDLETALAAEFAGSFGPAGTGKTITVDVDELTLATSFTPTARIEDARLAGRVTMENPDGTTAAAYDVAATSSDAAAFLASGSNVTTVSPASAEYYQAIVRAFARGTAETLRASGA
jgi:hypothetical protein